MADTKISQLTTLAAASVASGDWIPIVDVSDTSMAATGTTKKVQATMAFTNTPNTFTADQTINALLAAYHLRSASITVAQNTAGIITPSQNLGIAVISVNFFPDVAGIIVYRAAASGFCSILAGGANLEATTGILTGTTGNNGKVTVSAHTDGNIYIEQRRGASVAFRITFLA